MNQDDLHAEVLSRLRPHGSTRPHPLARHRAEHFARLRPIAARSISGLYAVISWRVARPAFDRGRGARCEVCDGSELFITAGVVRRMCATEGRRSAQVDPESSRGGRWVFFVRKRGLTLRKARRCWPLEGRAPAALSARSQLGYGSLQSINTNRMRHGCISRLTHPWLVAC